MLVKKSQANPEKVNDNSTIFDYPMPDETTGIAYQNLNGRIPQKGWQRNTVCDEIMFFTGGKATIHVDTQIHEIEEGDMVILKKGQKHYGEYENTQLITITSPNWYEEQCEVIEE
jgi:mannose-6-phosphate isomerase-like protein (cupin superfamily)